MQIEDFAKKFYVKNPKGTIDDMIGDYCDRFPSLVDELDIDGLNLSNLVNHDAKYDVDLGGPVEIVRMLKQERLNQLSSLERQLEQSISKTGNLQKSIAKLNKTIEWINDSALTSQYIVLARMINEKRDTVDDDVRVLHFVQQCVDNMQVRVVECRFDIEQLVEIEAEFKKSPNAA